MNKKEENQQNDFEEIRQRFNKWRFNMYLCAGLYIVFFIIARLAITSLIQGKPLEGWLKRGSETNRWPIIIVAIILGFCFIADSIITSYLKTPLQRLAIKIENSSLEEKKKSHLMRATQETNELFKETFKKFGILVIPTILISLIDGKGGFEDKPSEDWFFYVCYLVPILFASYRIWKVNSELNKIQKKVMNNERKKWLRS